MFKLRNLILIPAPLLVLVWCATIDPRSIGTTLHYGESLGSPNEGYTRLLEKAKEAGMRLQEVIL